MGSSQEYSPTNSNRKPDLFDQAEQAAFRHVNANLCAMPFCSRADLEQAAKSYFYASVNESGAGHLFREAYVEGKAATWAAWWFRKHRDRRTPRPHTKYTPAQAARGRRVALIRKRGATDWTALRAQLARDRGDKLAAIARGTRVQPSHGVQTEQAAISPDRRGGLVLLLRVDTR